MSGSVGLCGARADGRDVPRGRPGARHQVKVKSSRAINWGAVDGCCAIEVRAGASASPAGVVREGPCRAGRKRNESRAARPRRVTRGATSYEVASPSTFVYLPYTSYKNRCPRQPSPALLVLRLVQLCSVISTVPYIALHPNARGHPIVQERCRARKSRGLPANLQADLKLTTCLASTEQPSRRADSPPRAAHGIMAERRSVRRAGERCCETGW